jgi:hypothetical protein
MKNEQRLAQMRKEFDALKLELGIAVNERDKLKAELKGKYGIRSTKEIEKMSQKLEAELSALEKKRDAKFDHIESRLQEYRR